MLTHDGTRRSPKGLSQCGVPFRVRTRVATQFTAGAFAALALTACGLSDSSSPATTTTVAASTTITVVSDAGCRASVQDHVAVVRVGIDSWAPALLARADSAAGALGDSAAAQLQRNGLDDSKQQLTQQQQFLTNFGSSACRGRRPNDVVLCLQAYDQVMAPISDRQDRDAPLQAQAIADAASGQQRDLVALANFQAVSHELSARLIALSGRTSTFADCQRRGL